MSHNLFESLWIEKYRPQTFSDLIMSEDLKSFVDKIKQDQQIPHILLCSGPGTGKTTFAKCLVKELDTTYRYINASDERGIDSIREKILPFAQTKSIDGKIKIVILDEGDGLTFDAQRILRNMMEEYADNIRFIITANYGNKIINPIRSRCQSFDIKPPIKDVFARVVRIIKSENINLNEEQVEKLKNLVHRLYPDIRKIIGAIQKNVTNNTLSIRDENNNTGFVVEVLSKIINNSTSTSSIREYIIHNELEFNVDYHLLLKNLFEIVFTKITNEEQRSKALIIIGDAMYKHQFVMDFEINAYCCILELCKILRS